MNWQVITPVQSEQLRALKIDGKSLMVWWFNMENNEWELRFEQYKFNTDDLSAYTLAEIAVMLGYTLVDSNVKIAAERLIEELKNGCSNANNCNARLKEAQSL